MSYPPQPPQPPQQPQGQYQQPQGQYPPNQYQPNQYQQYGQYPAVQPKTSPLALTGFIMALSAVVLVWLPGISLLGWLINLAAFIISLIGNSQVKNSHGALTGKGLAVAGIVISCVLFGIFVIIAILALVAGAALLSTFAP